MQKNTIIKNEICTHNSFIKAFNYKYIKSCNKENLKKNKMILFNKIVVIKYL